MKLLHDKTCLITGASRGIGRAAAELFAQHGANLVLAGRDLTALELVAEECRRHGAPSALAKACDVGDEKQVRDLFKAVFTARERLDVLFANAGILEDAMLGMANAAMIERVYRTNVFGLIYCAQYGSRLMARTGGGSIITMGSIVGEHGHAGQTVYSSSKAAVVGATRSMAKELAAQAIRVNAIAPGLITTSMADQLPPEKRGALLKSIGAGKEGTPEDVANVALFLASDLSTYVTGQVIGVDGSMVI